MLRAYNASGFKPLYQWGLSIPQKQAIMAKTAIARARRSKADVQQEFLKIREEATAERESKHPKIEEAAKLKEAEVRQAVESVSVEGVAERISGLSVQISKALAEVSEELSAEVRRLATIREAVGLESAELDRLHKIDVTATVLDQLMSQQRAAWDIETRARERADREYDENLKKQRQRETEEYEYKKALERKKAQDKYDEEIRTLERKNRERQETLDKTWQAREVVLKEREEEFVRLRQEVDAFPSQLQAETERARREAIEKTEQRFEQQVLLTTKEREGDRRLFELQVKALEESVNRQAVQITALQRQLDEAKQQVQDIAVKAIEGASGARALAHVNQIAMEQAKTRAGQP
jgi:hypothetical protein